MPTEYLPHLIQLAQVGGELASIQNDLQNASTTLALQDVVKRLFNVESLHLYHSIHDAVNRDGQQAVEPVRQPAPAPVQQAPALSPQASMHSSFGLPGLIPNRPPIISQPGLAPPPPTACPASRRPTSPTCDHSPGDPGDPRSRDRGTDHPAPQRGGRFRPHVRPAQLPLAPPGVAQVVVPAGGAVTPELAAALAAR